MFEWDERKRALNLDKHDVDFRSAASIFDGPTLEGEDTRRDYGEARIGAYGIANGEVLFVVYTMRGTARRLISARKAGNDEQKAYLERVQAAQD